MTASLTNAFGWIVTRPAALRRAIKDLFRKDVSKASFHAVATIYEWYVDNETGDLDATWYACFENALGERKAVFGYTNPALRTHEGKSSTI